MNLGELFRREWGAVTFVLTVLAGLVIVPVAFVFLNHGAGQANLVGLSASPSPTAAASEARTATPTPSPVATPTPAPSASP
ncbi:MAG: hypothetical protein NVS9B1_05050 [Candidatus Dormibacteraceae bacterium]